jgi:hypothetical protein
MWGLEDKETVVKTLWPSATPSEQDKLFEERELILKERMELVAKILALDEIFASQDERIVIASRVTVLDLRKPIAYAVTGKGRDTHIEFVTEKEITPGDRIILTIKKSN